MSEFFERPPATDRTLLGRMIRAARLDERLYAEVESDPAATGQAAMVVLLAALAGGVNAPGGPFQALLGGLLALGSWIVFAYLIYLIGGRLLPEPQTQAHFKPLLRALGFANAPGVIRLLGVVAELRGLVLFVSAMWMLAATVTAVRHALSYSSPWRAIGVCAIPLLGQLLVIAAVLAYVDSAEDPQGVDEPPVVLP